MSAEKGLVIGVASDHAGKELKSMVIEYLQACGQEAVDLGVDAKTTNSVDYADYAAILAQEILAGNVTRGVAICGTGIGMSIAANKFAGIRATLVWDEFTTRMARAHNDSNVLCFGARTLNPHRAIDLLKIWLETPCEGGRHQVRLDKIKKIEQKNFQTGKGR
jgi:ribose 5-phosphate isomerase B